MSLARDHGGKLVDVTARGGAREPEEWCGTMWFKPWPPPKAANLIQDLIERGYVLEVFPLGIPHLDAARIVVRNQARG